MMKRLPRPRWLTTAPASVWRVEEEGACRRVTAPPARPPAHPYLCPVCVLGRCSHGMEPALVAGPSDLTVPLRSSVATVAPLTRS
ncbi:hypothetical protein E2C01_005083 [Portunus trituberculatus]|uniref:Uncharacterized protein n=1 Tax=Portunus trituberculatus TaxID=210409 RepID=A0A5B7CY65_PORTR|nr:hypothetical protein [Portunus trituberculatus]